MMHLYFQFYHDARELQGLIGNEMEKVKRQTKSDSFKGDIKEAKDMTRFMKASYAMWRIDTLRSNFHGYTG